ncbi:bifunctional serine/threonine-protein kinase/glutamate ABC transporter substrate-binding protein [Streptomyces sp. H10-C2]|uniref:bifunctional serine/threonine-protein kinase/glutamate ABC transporter substrate-binding protein n=1 Tax=unclassified Streptomyces TaxID=2593676 RepID=UPI0024B88E5F|nr:MULTISPECIES: bifunctional serine/threonine-protein kinase/glutamate ABC transporter substrate-binding protein [unclassified Streptomyces]MDJ0341612.1 bifunctional serine/threonine-protein kinase/glutamate ABC transporter substrate-binding protein [Streptomyces sp. PH10-H1]MDJ0371286.1 bifunctional serine/threonine-protein kinase/glutamate ABC transporter substrate-binding protein [Streptomyces sp. H10-C2]
MRNGGTPGGGPHTLVDGRYELQRPLGRGGMGVVWEAYDNRLGRQVAVKELLFRGAVDPDTQAQWVERARREARAIARIGHEHVVAVHDVIEADGQVWIVMEQVNPRSLADQLQEHGRLPALQVARVGLEVLRGLRAVHAAGVLHRDVKPHNILFRRDGRAVLMDFGIATFEGAAQVTRMHELVGTPRYLAPELCTPQGRSPHEATPAADLWSLGVALYETVEGRAPFRGPTPYEVLEAVREAEPPPMEHCGPLRPLIEGLLVKDPAARLTARRAEQLLQHVAQETPQHPMSFYPADGRPPEAESSWARRTGGYGGTDTADTGATGTTGTDAIGSGGSDPDASVVSDSSSESLSDPRSGPGGSDGLGGGSGAHPPPVSLPPARRPADGPSRGLTARLRGPLRWPAAALALVVLVTAGWFTVDRLTASAGPSLDSSATIRAARERGFLLVGVKGDQPGLSERSPGSEGGFRGFDIDIARSVAAHLGFDTVRFEVVNTQSREYRLSTGQVDLIVASYSITQERKQSVDFAGPYYVAGQDFLVPARATGVSGVADLDGRKVCTVQGSTPEARLRTGYPRILLEPRASYGMCVTDLLAGTVDAVSTDDVILAGYRAQHPAELRLLGAPFGSEQYGVGLHRGEPALRGAVCDAIRDEISSGRWKDSYDTYLKPLAPKELADQLPPDQTECG